MTPAEGRERILKELEARGVSRWTTAPPLWRFLWRMRVGIPPPHFMGFGWLWLLSGSLFAITFGATLHVWGRVAGGPPPVPGFGFPAAAGVVFGLYVAWSWRRARITYRLPSWEEYLRSEKGPDGEKTWDLLPPPGPPTSPPSPGEPAPPPSR